MPRTSGRGSKGGRGGGNGRGSGGLSPENSFSNMVAVPSTPQRRVPSPIPSADALQGPAFKSTPIGKSTASCGQNSITMQSPVTSADMGGGAQQTLRAEIFEDVHNKLLFFDAVAPDPVFDLKKRRAHRMWQPALDKLKAKFFDAAGQPKDDLMALKKYKQNKSPETDCYIPLHKILNEAKGLAPINNGYLTPRKFVVYEKQVIGVVDNAKGELKPDGLCLLARLILQRASQKRFQGRYRWSETFFSFDAKYDFTDLIKQLATYGTAQFQCGRWYSMTLGYCCTDSSMFFCFYTPQAMYVGRSYDITTFQGLAAIVEVIWAMCAMTEYQCGIHPFMRRHGGTYHFLLPTIRPALLDPSSKAWLQMSEVFCRRIGVTGRLTLAGRMTVPKVAKKVTAPLDVLAISDKHTFITPGGRTLRPGPRTERRDTKTEPILPKTEPPPLGPIQDKGEPLGAPSELNFAAPKIAKDCQKLWGEWCKGLADITKSKTTKSLVLRRSFPTRNHVATEVAMLRSRSPEVRHGLAQSNAFVVSNYGWEGFSSLEVVPHPKLKHDKTLYADPAKPLELQERVELITFTETVGCSLMTCEGPKPLVRTVLDCIIGHLHWFMDGYLQRDVSLGNLLRREEVEKRDDQKRAKNNDFVNNLPCLQGYLSECRGFITDVDQAVKWNEPYEHDQDRSATWPFLSCQILHQWRNGKDIVHTAVDDLESFAWVVLWIALRHSDEYQHSQDWLSDLRSDLKHLRGQKTTIIDDLTNNWNLASQDCSPTVTAVRPLLADWFGIQQKLRGECYQVTQNLLTKSGPKAMEMLEQLCLKAYTMYLDAADKFLKNDAASVSWKVLLGKEAKLVEARDMSRLGS